jgi:hypothetical protein
MSRLLPRRQSPPDGDKATAGDLLRQARDFIETVAAKFELARLPR